MKKKKRFLSLVLTASMCASMCIASPVMADSRKVVTLGVDLSEEQKGKILRYFGVTLDNVDVIYINNQQERDALGSYIPLEQIGTHTYSCAMVNPTISGGIQVKTANLNYVTCNMIASTLSTSGVTNCQVLAASPFEVSGTGALTGIILAYEKATETTLDPVKKDLANQEVIVTGTLAQEVGQSTATAVVNETKTKVIEGNVTDIGDIGSIVNNVTNEYNVQLSEEEKATISELMKKIAEQDYDIAQMKVSLDKVQANVIGDTQASDEKKDEAIKQAQASADEAKKLAQEALEEAKKNQPQSETSSGTGDVLLGEEGDVIDTPIETEAPAVSDVSVDPVETESILDNTDLSALEGDGVPVNEGTTTQTVEEQKASESETEFDWGFNEETESFGGEELVGEETEWVGAETDAAVIDTEAPVVDTEAPVAETEAPETEIPVTEPETAPVVEDDKEDLPAISEEDYNKFMSIKEELENEISDGVIQVDDTEVTLSQETVDKVLKDVETYIVVLFSKGATVVSEEEHADGTATGAILTETYDMVAVKDYTDAVMVQLDKYARRYILKDSDKVFESENLSDESKVALYKSVIGILEDNISAETEEVTPEEMGTEGLEEGFDDAGVETLETQINW